MNSTFLEKCFGMGAVDLNKKILKICTTTILPFVDCNTDGPSNPAGFDLELFREAASLSGFLENIHYSFKCVPSFSDVLEGVSTCKCDAGVGSITPTVDRSCIQNITFSSSYFPTSLGVLTKTTSNKNMFTFLRPFDTNLWVLIVCTSALLVPLSLLLLRRLQISRNPYPYLRRMPYVIVDSVQAALGNADTSTTELQEDENEDSNNRLVSLATQLFFVIYAFWCLVIVSLFTANLAAFATLNILHPDIVSIDQLAYAPNTRIVSNDIYVGSLIGRYGIKAVAWDNFEGSTTVIDAANKVANGTLDAVITDRGLLAYALKTIADPCSLAFVTDTDLSFFGLSIAWSGCAPRELVDNWNIKLLQISETGEVERLARSALNDLFPLTLAGGAESSFCRGQQRDSVQLTNVSGLWIFLAAGFAIAFALASIPRLRRIHISGWSNS